MLAFLFRKILGVIIVGFGVAWITAVVYFVCVPNGPQRKFEMLLGLTIPAMMIWIGGENLKDWRRKSSDEPARYPHFVFAKIMDPIAPSHRGQKYDDPLHQLLEQRGLGEVSGGGSELTQDGNIESIGLDIELANLQQALQLTRQTLRELGAPAGSVLQYEIDGERVSLPIHA